MLIIYIYRLLYDKSARRRRAKIALSSKISNGLSPRVIMVTIVNSNMHECHTKVILSNPSWSNLFSKAAIYASCDFIAIETSLSLKFLFL